MWDRRARVEGIHDGDTLDPLVVDQGWGDTKTFTKPGARLLNVWAPELNQPGGVETREFVHEWVKLRESRSGLTKWPFVWISARMPIADRDQQTLGRYVGTLTSQDGTENLNAAIMQFVLENGWGGGTGS